MDINVYTPEQQATGQFDGGKITELKPIGFPGEGSEVKGLGPLFYWSWAKAEKAGYIPLHPHSGFEIITYIVNGKAEHGDTLGTKSIVGVGGLQLMQTGSGVSHEEGFVGPNMEGFQIWFEPYLNDAVKRKPTYKQYAHEDFPLEDQKDFRKKTIIGENSPVELVANVEMFDFEVNRSRELNLQLPANYSLALLAIRGGGAINGKSFSHQDFTVASTGKEEKITIQASDEADLRLIAIIVPTTVDYPLYRK